MTRCPATNSMTLSVNILHEVNSNEKIVHSFENQESKSKLYVKYFSVNIQGI